MEEDKKQAEYFLADLRQCQVRVYNDAGEWVERPDGIHAAKIEKYIRTLEAKIAALEAKVEDLRNACREQHRALCEICYAIEEPNEMGVSTQDVFPDSERVKSAVRELRDKFTALKEAQGEGLPNMLLAQANRRRDELNAALRKIERLEGEKGGEVLEKPYTQAELEAEVRKALRIALEYDDDSMDRSLRGVPVKSDDEIINEMLTRWRSSERE